MEQFYRGSAAALKSMYLLPMAIPAASVVVLWKILFDSHGFVNSAIHALSGMSGIGQILNVLSVQEVDWMNTDAAFGILVFSYVWKYLGYDIVLWMAGLSAIPQGIYEAAEMDGAGKWKTFFYITLPNLRPVAFTVVILSVLNSFKAFREVYMAAGSYPQENIDKYLDLFKLLEQTRDVTEGVNLLSEKLGEYLDEEVVTNMTEIATAVNATKGAKFELVFDPTLVRGMSYYTGTIFEISMPELGAACGGGGRYDKMIGKFTGNDVPACGFSIGFERIILLLMESGFKIPESPKKVAYLVEKKYPADKLVDVMNQAKDARANGQQVLVVRMNKNKKFQKEQLMKEGYEEFVEFFNR
jgi:ABC-type molybdate transport system permease subunit